MRILFVAMPDSVHAARWINQVSGENWDVHLFSAYEAPVHPALRAATVYSLSFHRKGELDASVRLRGLWPLERGAGTIRRSWKRMFPGTLTRASWLAALIRWLKPQIVHSLEMQHAGYLTLDAKQLMEPSFPPWAVSLWGSDISYYRRLTEHHPRIRAVMTSCDYLHADCERDIGLSRDFGFDGKFFGVFPVGGGFDVEEMGRLRQPGATSSRRLIVLSGRQGEFGRALVGLRALALCADVLEGYRIVLPLADPDVKDEALRLAERTGLELEPRVEWVSRERMLALHGAARASIRLGVGDGASHTLLEALAMGSYPVISCTACADEWVLDGESGAIVPPDDPAAIAAAVRRALTDDGLVDRAAEHNARVARERLDERVIRPQVVRRYEDVLAGTG